MVQAGPPVTHQVTDARATRCVGHRREHAARLVHREMNQVARGRQAVAVDPDDVALRVGSGTEGRHQAVDLDAAGCDQLFAGPPTAETGCCQDLLQADGALLVGSTLNSTWRHLPRLMHRDPAGIR